LGAVSKHYPQPGGTRPPRVSIAPVTESYTMMGHADEGMMSRMCRPGQRPTCIVGAATRRGDYAGISAMAFTDGWQRPDGRPG